MATNKRKDSAALFELIDKSTLKVPKHTGSLKIPSWWSSKSNPPMPAGQADPAGNGSYAAHAGAARPAGSQAAVQPAGSQSASPPPQTRLFEPPPADISSAASPSIRPPAPPAAPRFAMVTASETHSATEPHPPANHAEAESQTPSAATLPTQEIPEQELDPLPPDPPVRESFAPPLPLGRRVFAPQTMSQDNGFRGDWASTQKARLARAPMWAMVAGASAIVILLVIIIYAVMLLRSAGTPKSAPSGAPLTSAPAGDGRSPSLQPSHIQQPILLQNHAGLLETQRDTPSPAAAQVFEPGKVQRSPNLYYIVIATTPTPEIARRNADLIARNGVDVSIETQMSRSNRLLYKLISVRGFSTIGEAAPLQKKIVAIGHLLPDFARTRKAWDDATVIKWSSLVNAAARG